MDWKTSILIILISYKVEFLIKSIKNKDSNLLSAYELYML